MRDSRGLLYSTVFHGILVMLLIFGLPSFFHRALEMEPESVTVDILPIAPVSNIKPQEETRKVEPKKEQKEETAPTPRPATHVKDEPKPEPVPIPVKPKETVKPPPPRKPPPKPKPAKEQNDFQKALDGIKQLAIKEGPKTEKSTPTPSSHTARSQTYDASQPLSMSEKDAIRSQIENKWNAPIGAKDAQNLIVTLHIEVNPDGAVTKVDLAGGQARYNSDSFFRAAVESAKRAVMQASPLKNLPADKYGTWREMDMDFNPSDAN